MSGVRDAVVTVGVFAAKTEQPLIACAPAVRRSISASEASSSARSVQRRQTGADALDLDFFVAMIDHQRRFTLSEASFSRRPLGVRNIPSAGKRSLVEAIIKETQQFLYLRAFCWHDEPPVVDGHDHADGVTSGFDLNNGMVVQDAAVADRMNQLSNRLVSGGDEGRRIGHLEMSVRGESLHFLIGSGAIDIKQADDGAELVETPKR